MFKRLNSFLTRAIGRNGQSLEKAVIRPNELHSPAIVWRRASKLQRNSDSDSDSKDCFGLQMASYELAELFVTCVLQKRRKTVWQ